MSIYDPLKRFLENSPTSCNEIKLSPNQIEIILGRKLPKSAYDHPAWWYDSSTHTNVRSWENVGWMVSIHSKQGKIDWVDFKRVKK